MILSILILGIILFGVLLGNCIIEKDYMGMAFGSVLIYWNSSLILSFIHDVKKLKKPEKPPTMNYSELMVKMGNLREHYHVTSMNAESPEDRDAKMAQCIAVSSCIRLVMELDS
jgi:hypothetical protein